MMKGSLVRSRSQVAARHALPLLGNVIASEAGVWERAFLLFQKTKLLQIITICLTLLKQVLNL